MWWNVIWFAFSQCFHGIVSGGASFAAPMAFMGWLFSRIFRSPSFFTILRLAGGIVVAFLILRTYWQQSSFYNQQISVEIRKSAAACDRHLECKQMKPILRYNSKHEAPCDDDKYLCESLPENRAWDTLVESWPGFYDILHTIESKFIAVSFLIIILSYCLPFLTLAPRQVMQQRYVNNGKKKLDAIVEDYINPAGADEILTD